MAAVVRMLAGENVSALAAELNILRKDLYKWRASFLSGGPAALRGPGRPAPAKPAEKTDSGTQPSRDSAHRRIAELERNLRRQQSELKAMRKALQQVEQKGRRDTD
jgi:transposase-like protein